MYMLKALFILFTGTLVVTALITPWVYHGFYLLWGEHLWPFSRVFDRVAMAVALGFIIYLRRHFSLGEVFRYFKAMPARKAFLHMGVGAFLTLLSVACTIPLLVHVTGDLLWEPDTLSTVLRKSGKIVIGAFLIGVIEEGFFRVLVLNALLKKLSKLKAVLFCSLLYAMVHFIAPIKSWHPEGFSWDNGLVYVSQLGAQFFHPTVPASFFGLVLVGIILSLVILHSRSVYLCVGLHAGWVIGVKAVKLVGDFNPALGIPSGRISQYFLVSLPVAWLSILTVGAVLWLFRTRLNFLKEKELA